MNILLLQYDIAWLQPEKNISYIKKELEDNDSDIDLVVLPEMCLSGFCMNAKKSSLYENDAHILDLISICELHNVAIIGSFAILEKDQFYNRVLLLAKEGILDRYDKQYLYSPSGEHKAFHIKHPITTMKYNGWNILPQVCYDLRFPEAVRALDAPDVLIYMANWPVPRIHHWDALLRARAIENQCFVLGVNRIGKDMNNWEYCGHSQVIAPNGDVEMIPENSFSMLVSLDKQEMVAYREKYQFLGDKM